MSNLTLIKAETYFGPPFQWPTIFSSLELLLSSLSLTSRISVVDNWIESELPPPRTHQLRLGRRVEAVKIKLKLFGLYKRYKYELQLLPCMKLDKLYFEKSIHLQSKTCLCA